MSAAMDSNGMDEDDDSGEEYVMRYASDETSSDDSQAAHEAEARLEEEEDAEVQTEDSSQPRKYKTTVKKRANSHVRRLKHSMTRFLTRFSRDNWAAQSSTADASAEVTAEGQEQLQAAPAEAVPSEQDQDPAAQSESTEPTAAAAVGAQRLTARLRKKAFVETQAFLAISMPDGRLVFYSSDGIRDNELAKHQRNLFVGSVALMAKEERIRGSNDRRAEVAARKLVKDSMELAATKHLPLSKQWRQSARQAFTAHIQPVNAGLRMCGQQDWKQCVVGHDSAECAAGGLCKEARAAHGWPDDLPCLNPARVDADTDWYRKFVLWQQSLGHPVTLPEEGAQR